MVDYNIFKFRHEIPLVRYREHCSVRPNDWPELEQRSIIKREMMKKAGGEAYDEELVASCVKTMRHTTTPTSRCYSWEDDEIAKLQPDPKKQGRPPYFFDP